MILREVDYRLEEKSEAETKELQSRLNAYKIARGGLGRQLYLFKETLRTGEKINYQTEIETQVTRIAEHLTKLVVSNRTLKFSSRQISGVDGRSNPSISFHLYNKRQKGYDTGEKLEGGFQSERSGGKDL